MLKFAIIRTNEAHPHLPPDILIVEDVRGAMSTAALTAFKWRRNHKVKIAMQLFDQAMVESEARLKESTVHLP